MRREFEMSMMGELTFFLGLQIKQSKEGIFINQSKYTQELLKRFGLENAKPRGTPISPSVNLIKDENGKDVDSKLFRDEDQDGYALFMFKFEKLGSEEDFEGLNSGMGLWGQDSCGFGFERKKMKKGLLRPAARSSSSSSLSSASSNCSSVMEWASVEENELKGPSGFSLLMYACKK
ncbi:hypothetical protein RJ640_027923 [Escallonia rubra]|uniref:Reverse transcriptase Ty1/copia-type domain-containing protein n=1 Tax=Escallonia rubra TaxID=112253 RepID=A0AA88RXB6_9ASTE|nr:hypothetical protein RJ640_027923 [Escallonia rubra]